MFPRDLIRNNRMPILRQVFRSCRQNGYPLEVVGQSVVLCCQAGGAARSLRGHGPLMRTDGKYPEALPGTIHWPREMPSGERDTVVKLDYLRMV